MTHRRKSLLFGIAGIAVAVASTFAVWNTQQQAATAATPGQPAPAFSVQDSNGKTRTLDEFKGKYVVLEWLNYDCPFVKKHYGSGNMQKLQRAAAEQGVVWLSVNSSAPGKQGHASGEQANALTKKNNAAPSAVLLDPEGAMGRAYGAKTTPHMYVIDPRGNLVYNGAIDNKPSTDVADIEGATNYVSAALEQSKKGEAVAISVSKPYGCSVKY